MLKHIKMVY